MRCHIINRPYCHACCWSPQWVLQESYDFWWQCVSGITPRSVLRNILSHCGMVHQLGTKSNAPDSELHRTSVRRGVVSYEEDSSLGISHFDFAPITLIVLLLCLTLFLCPSSDYLFRRLPHVVPRLPRLVPYDPPQLLLRCHP